MSIKISMIHSYYTESIVYNQTKPKQLWNTQNSSAASVTDTVSLCTKYIGFELESKKFCRKRTTLIRKQVHNITLRNQTHTTTADYSQFESHKTHKHEHIHTYTNSNWHSSDSQVDELSWSKQSINTHVWNQSFVIQRTNFHHIRVMNLMLCK